MDCESKPHCWISTSAASAADISGFMGVFAGTAGNARGLSRALPATKLGVRSRPSRSKGPRWPPPPPLGGLSRGLLERPEGVSQLTGPRLDTAVNMLLVWSSENEGTGCGAWAQVSCEGPALGWWDQSTML